MVWTSGRSCHIVDLTSSVNDVVKISTPQLNHAQEEWLPTSIVEVPDDNVSSWKINVYFSLVNHVMLDRKPCHSTNKLILIKKPLNEASMYKEWVPVAILEQFVSNVTCNNESDFCVIVIMRAYPTRAHNN